jgi:hypothetical protein
VLVAIRGHSGQRGTEDPLFFIILVREISQYPSFKRWHAVARLVEALRYKPEGSIKKFPMVSLEFFIDKILPAALWPWV